MFAAVGWWCLIFLGAAGLLVASFYLDASAQTWMTQHRHPGVRNFMEAVSRYGDWPEHLIVGFVLIAIAFWRGSKKWLRIFAAMILACCGVGTSS